MAAGLTLPDDSALEALAAAVGERLLRRGEMLATAESCTGGGVSAVLTAIAGSSRWFERGFVTYANAAKTEMLGVPATTLERHGAVAEATARAMAQGALASSHADWALAITGIAGPDSGSAEKPVGTVCFAWAHGRAEENRAVTATTCHFAGDRAAVRRQAVAAALSGLLELLALPQF